MSKGINPKKPRIVVTRREKQILSRKIKKTASILEGWKGFQTKGRKARITENRTFVKENFGRLDLFSQNSLHYHKEPEGRETTKEAEENAVAANSTALRPETRSQEGNPCSGTMERRLIRGSRNWIVKDEGPLKSP